MTLRLPKLTTRWKRPTSALLIALIVVALGGAGSPLKADDDEHDVEQGVEAGEVMPLDRLVARIGQEVGGRVLRVELERETDDDKPGWIYEAKVLTPEGHVLKLEYDAKTLELLEIKGRHGRRHHDDDD